VESYIKRNRIGELVLDGRIILKWILEEQDERV
jgi:hypothetical protein